MDDGRDGLLAAVAAIQRDLARLSLRVEKLDKATRRSGRFTVNVAANILANLAAASIAYIAAVATGFLVSNNAILIAAEGVVAVGLFVIIVGGARYAASGGDKFRIWRSKRVMKGGVYLGLGCLPSAIPAWVGRAASGADLEFMVAIIAAEVTLTLLLSFIFFRGIDIRKRNRLHRAGFKMRLGGFGFYFLRIFTAFVFNGALIVAGYLLA